MSKPTLNAAAAEWKPNAAAAEWTPQTASATPTPNSTKTTPSLRTEAQAWTPTQNQTHQFVPQPFYPQQFSQPGFYDPYQQQTFMYGGHYPPYNMQNQGYPPPSMQMGGYAGNQQKPVNDTAASSSETSASEPTDDVKIVVEAAASVASTDTASDEKVPDDAAQGSATEEDTSGWSRGAMLKTGDEEAVATVAESVGVSGLKAPATPWKRGSSMAEKTTAHMLTRDDGITRYSKADMFTFNTPGKICPDDIASTYGVYAKKERQPSSENRVAPKSPSYKRRGNRRQEELEEPHPDEKLIFSKENMTDEGKFRHDPNKLEEDTPEATIMKAKLILNQLSLENFDKLSVKFMQIGMETEDMMSKIVDLIVSKAQLEEPFCFMYADLCKKITEQWTVVPGGDEEENPLGKTFRTILLLRCQSEFESDREAAVQEIMDMDLAEDDREEKLLILKQRYTGHMRFVGEIYMKDMIKANKIHFCINLLLESREEEKLHCLCKLMTTVGKKLEEYELKKKRTTVADYFKTIADISKDKTYSSKIRFLFQDLIDMRKNNWTARRVEEKAKKQSTFRAQESPHGNAGGSKFPGSGNNTPRGGGGGFGAPKGPQDARAAAPPAEDGWSVAGGGKKGGKGGSRAAAAATAPASNSGGFGTTVSNKFSALGNAGAEAGSKGSKGKGKNGMPQIQTNMSEASSKGSVSREDSGYSSGESSPASSPLKRHESDSTQASSYPSAVGEDGKLDSHSVGRVVAAMNEFFLNDMLDEAVEVMRELVHPNAMGEALRGSIVAILEKKDLEREKYNKFLTGLVSSGHLSGEQSVKGLSHFLDSYDDIVIDVPKVGDYVASIVATLYMAGALDDLGFMLSLPDENNFSYSMGIFDLIVKSAVVVASLKDQETAKELVTASLREKTPLDDMQQEQLTRAVEKCSAQYLL